MTDLEKEFEQYRESARMLRSLMPPDLLPDMLVYLAIKVPMRFGARRAESLLGDTEEEREDIKRRSTAWQEFMLRAHMTGTQRTILWLLEKRFEVPKREVVHAIACIPDRSLVEILAPYLSGKFEQIQTQLLAAARSAVSDEREPENG